MWTGPFQKSREICFCNHFILMEITWLIWAVYKALLLHNELFYLNTHKYYVNTMDIFDHFASKLFVALVHSSGLWLCNWILLSASCVYKSKTFWLATNVILVESESTSHTIGRRMHGLKSDINRQDSFFIIYFFYVGLNAARRKSVKVPEKFKPCESEALLGLFVILVVIISCIVLSLHIANYKLYC